MAAVWAARTKARSRAVRAAMAAILAAMATVQAARAAAVLRAARGAMAAYLAAMAASWAAMAARFWLLGLCRSKVKLCSWLVAALGSFLVSQC